MKAKQKIRKELEGRLDTVRLRVEKIRRDLERETMPLESDWQEAAVTRENDEVLDGLEREGIEQISALQEALQRLDAGNYGTCSRCRLEIGVERLEALPQATLCIDCASAAQTG